jgi:uncharacterized membrane protein YgcG
MNILPVVGGIISLFGAFRQQQQADTAAGLSREALELQKRVVDAYLKELEELKPYREAMRELAATRMTMAPIGWSRWTSDPWRLTPSLPPIQKLLNTPKKQPENGNDGGNGGKGGKGGNGGGGGGNNDSTWGGPEGPPW